MILEQLLQSGLSDLNLVLAQDAQEKLLEYIKLLNKWNKVYSLTAISEPKEILIRHIFDSLAIVPYIVGPKVLDFGTGAGLPGIPLALTLPECKFVLLDSSSKKTKFLNHVKFILGISNIEIINKRIELFNTDKFNTIVSRATVADLSQLVNWVSHLKAPSGQILAMRGKIQEEKMGDSENYKIVVPYLNEERHLWRQK